MPLNFFFYKFQIFSWNNRMVKNCNWVNQPSKWPCYPEIIFCFPVYIIISTLIYTRRHVQSDASHYLTFIPQCPWNFLQVFFCMSVSIQTLSGTPLRLKVDDKKFKYDWDLCRLPLFLICQIVLFALKYILERWLKKF